MVDMISFTPAIWMSFATSVVAKVAQVTVAGVVLGKYTPEPQLPTSAIPNRTRETRLQTKG